MYNELGTTVKFLSINPSYTFYRFKHLKDLLRFLCTVNKDNNRTCETFNFYEIIVKI